MQTPKHEKATIYIPVEGSVLDTNIDHGSGVVGIRKQPSGMLVIYYEGNRFDASNMREGRERVICAFGRLAVQYPTTAMRGVMPEYENQLIAVGEITWPNVIEFFSPDTEIMFDEYMAKYRPSRAQGDQMCTEKAARQFDVSVEMPGFTRTLGICDELSPDFLLAFNETKQSEGTFPRGVVSVVSASVSGDSDDIEDGESKVFVRATLRISATSESEAKRTAILANGLLAVISDVLAEQADSSIELDECSPDVEIEEVYSCMPGYSV